MEKKKKRLLRDCKLICFDYSQIELRLLSQIANIISLKKAFLKNQDIHKLTASQILNIPIEKVSGKERRDAKYKFWYNIWSICFWSC